MTQPAPATTYKPRSSKLWWSVTAALLLSVIAAAILVDAAAGQPATRPVLEDDGSVSHNECAPSSTVMCTPYATEAYKRKCDPDYAVSIPAGYDEHEFHSSPNFCPKVLPDGRVRYSQANCRMARWSRGR